MQDNHNPIIILGSSRSDGDTLRAVKALVGNKSMPLVDLLDLKISYFDYSYKNREDDFIPLAEKMVEHDPIILATPVYWYTMSAPMKTFIDRWSDLLDIRKDLGRRLANKELYVIAAYGGELPGGFEDAFSNTCTYLKMKYKGCFYYYTRNDPKKIEKNTLAIEQFNAKICPTAF